MLIRKTALAAASLAATLAGANQAEAGLFGRRICCPATPVQCPPAAMCQPSSEKMIGNNVSFGPVNCNPCLPSSVPIAQFSECQIEYGMVPCSPPSYFQSAPMIVTQSTSESVPQLRQDTVQVTLSNGNVQDIPILIPVGSSAAEEIAFRNIYENLYTEMLNSRDALATKDSEQDETLDKHQKRLDKDPANAP